MLAERPRPTYSIRDLARLSGLSSDRIRAWELRYGLLEPRRRASGYRAYTAEDLRLLLALRRRLQSGERIGALAARGRKALLAEENEPGPVPGDRVAAALRASILSLRRGDMGKTCLAIDEAGRLAGADQFYRSFARPLLVEVGDLWAVGGLPIWMEHYVTRHLRRRLEALWAVEGEARGPAAILFCPEGELHEISLLGVATRLRASGYRPLILGENLPVESAVQAAEASGAALAAVSITYLPTPAAARALAARLAVLSGRCAVLAGGQGAMRHRKEFESAGIRVWTFDELEDAAPRPARGRRTPRRA